MTLLVLGLLLFLGAHSVRVFADGWRTRQIARIGEMAWKGLYTLVSVAGFALIVVGYGAARTDPVILWNPPAGMRHATVLLTLLAFVLIVAAYVPGNHLKQRFGHPMVLGVKLWAFGHLLSNGTLADLLLFGGFLAWGVLDFVSLRRRDRRAGVVAKPGTGRGDLIAVVAGIVAWTVFAFLLHGPLIGVAPMHAL